MDGKIRLAPEDFEVESFPTLPEDGTTPPAAFAHPTDATRCFHCPLMPASSVDVC